MFCVLLLLCFRCCHFESSSFIINSDLTQISCVLCCLLKKKMNSSHWKLLCLYYKYHQHCTHFDDDYAIAEILESRLALISRSWQGIRLEVNERMKNGFDCISVYFHRPKKWKLSFFTLFVAVFFLIEFNSFLVSVCNKLSAKGNLCCMNTFPQHFMCLLMWLLERRKKLTTFPSPFLHAIRHHIKCNALRVNHSRRRERERNF